MTLQQEYEDYIAKVYKNPLGAVQRAEMNKAFFAGALVILGALSSCAQDEDATVKMVEDMCDEIAKFAKEL